MYKNNKGITLIALVITIIVMLILVGVTISMAVNGGLFDYAGRAVSETNNALKAEQQLADGGIKVGDTWYNSIDEYLNKDQKVETISKTESYIGSYADIDGDGTVDGVIYADLAFSSEEDANWNGYSYSYEAIPAEELKDYYVSKTANGDFGNGIDVLTATGEGKDRFYVMSLEDIDTCSWYQSKAADGIEVSTSGEFGTGKTNTITMIELWNADSSVEEDSNDVWGVIQNSEEYDIVETANDSGKWFVPSQAEWASFAEELEITNDGDAEKFYGNYGLRYWYWSSSQYDTILAWHANLDEDDSGDFSNIGNSEYVRLSATF